MCQESGAEQMPSPLGADAFWWGMRGVVLASAGCVEDRSHDSGWKGWERTDGPGVARSFRQSGRAHVHWTLTEVWADVSTGSQYCSWKDP